MGNLIDRSLLFEPRVLLNEKWLVWRGPLTGHGLTGERAEEEQSLLLTEVNLASLSLEDARHEKEGSITFEEKTDRLKKMGAIRLDAQIFQSVLENPESFPEKWKENVKGGTRYVVFDGTIIRNSFGKPCILYAYWSNGQLVWGYRWIGCSWDERYPSAVLKPARS